VHPKLFAETVPERLACIMSEGGESLTYAELDRRSSRGANLFRSLNLNPGDVIAILLDNDLRYFELVWAAQRAGLYYTCISTKLSLDEVIYILRDSGAKMLITAPHMKLAADLAPHVGGLKLFMLDRPVAPFESFETAREQFPEEPMSLELAGGEMLYSSGTTGRPKGVKLPLSGGPADEPHPLVAHASNLFEWKQGCIFLCPAPIYHSAPLNWSMTVQRLGGTVILMEKFDAERGLALIERFRCDCGMFVPTHFIRMLKLPDEVRHQFDLSSMKSAVHAAAPCPVPVKEKMIAWWGEVLFEFYSGTERNGLTAINAAEWLTHKGSVGKAVLGEIRICDDLGEPLPPGSEGLVYFAGGRPLSYHNAPDRIAEATNKYGWTTLGDVGRLDDEGYLYLTDRKSFMIISGGVNIYPQEIENHLITHPRVADVAVVGAPDEDMGEKVVAVIQPVDWDEAGESLTADLLAFARSGLGPLKVPRVVDYMKELPRHATGKLYKRAIRDRYWSEQRAAQQATDTPERR
jgi:long-chain acyl-CoA synthetase